MYFKLALVGCVIALAGCQSGPKPTLASEEMSANLPQPIRTFQQLCMTNLDQPAAIIAAGQEAGFDMDVFAEDKAMGRRKSTDETLQVNVFTRNAFECAITTGGREEGAEWTAIFFESLGIESSGTSATFAIKKVEYTLLHDRNGGENFVVYRRR